MRLLRWCGRALVAVGQWLVVFFVLANLAQLLPGGGMFVVRTWGPLIGSFFATAWLRRRLRARRAFKAAQEGREGAGT